MPTMDLQGGVRNVQRKGLLKPVAMVAILLSIAFTFVSIRAITDLDIDEATCRVDGAQPAESKAWKLYREFRRLIQGPRKINKFAWIDNKGRTIEMHEKATAHHMKKLSRDGQLKVKIISAANLHDSDWYGKQDAYVECFLHTPVQQDPPTFANTDAASKFKTKTVDDKNNPVWDDERTLPYSADEELRCTVFDYDYLDGDDELGHVAVPANRLDQGSMEEKDWPLQYPAHASAELKVHEGATLRIAITFVPTSETGSGSGDDPAAADSTEEGSAAKEPFWWACTARVRKEWMDLTEPEQNLYLAAVNKLKTTPRKGLTSAGPGENIYDTFVMIHESLKNKEYAHQTAGFLAWHRKYLMEYEEALRTVDEQFKCVTLPYWDWSSEMFRCNAGAAAGQTIGDGGVLDTPGCDTYHAASKLLTDFGGPGDAEQTDPSRTHGSSGSGPVGCVTTGPFKDWVDHHGKCLSRGVNWAFVDESSGAPISKPFTGRVEVLRILKYPDYGNQNDRDGFRVVMEGVPHGGTHNYLGGHMRSFISPADPIFFSHHAFVDKLWSVWQDCHDYDTAEIKTKLTNDPNLEENYKYYEPTTHYEGDRANDPMQFWFSSDTTGLGDPADKVCMATGSDCEISNEACALCVHGRDTWCVTETPWDPICCSSCASTQCASACGAAEPAEVDMNGVGSTYLEHWIPEENTPTHMYSVHHMMPSQCPPNAADCVPHERSYTYAPDEIDKELKQNWFQEMWGGCNIDSHALAQEAAGVLGETSRFHHAGTPHGKAAYAYAMMIEQAFNETKKKRDKENANGGLRMEPTPTKKINSAEPSFFEESMRLAQTMECKEMAGKCGDYTKEYNCKVDQPRFWIPWLGPEQWAAIMGKPEMKQAVFQDPCCYGDPEALEPGNFHTFLNWLVGGG